MVLPIAIDAVGVAIAVVVVWYVLFTRYNRRRGALVLQWVEAACATRGRIITHYRTVSDIAPGQNKQYPYLSNGERSVSDSVPCNTLI